MKINWKGLLGLVIGELLKILRPWVQTGIEKLVEWAYNAVEDWAEELQGTMSSTEKMAKAVTLVQAMEPKISGPKARILLELKHLEVTDEEEVE